mgnify:CR=1 FL=1
MDLRTQMTDYIHAGASGFWITSHEEARLIPEIHAIASQTQHAIARWTAVQGLMQDDTCLVGPDMKMFGALEFLKKYARSKSDRMLAMICDPHEHFTMLTTRYVKEMLLEHQPIMVFITPKPDCIPIELARLLTPLTFALPTVSELAQSFATETKQHRTQLAEAGVGMTLHEFTVAARLVLNRHGPKKIREATSELWHEKAKLWNDTGLLCVEQPKVTWNDFGGAYEFKKYFERILPSFTSEGQAAGITPRGMVFVGAFGVGKSLLCQVMTSQISTHARRQWNYIRWDLGRCLNPYVGASEQNVDKLLEYTEIHAPCLVDIDEFAHQVSGFESSGYSDSGVVSRMMGKLLTWLANRPSGTFIVASTNEPWRIPAHMLRAGRFDSIWMLSLPGKDALEDILRIHLRRYNVEEHVVIRDSYMMCMVLQHMHEERFSGAEVEQVVIDTKRLGYPASPSAMQFEEALKAIVTAANRSRDDITKIEQWARDNARPA